MSIIDGRMFFVPGGGQISEVNYKDLSFDIKKSYKAPDALNNKNDIFKTDDYYYFSSTPQILVRTKNLEGLINGNYEDLTSLFSLNTVLPFKI